MGGFSVRDDLKDHYEQFNFGKAEALRLGAAARTKNIVEMCGKHPHGTILDIGSGEGTVLSMLSAQRFGEHLFSLEISETAVRSIREKNIPSLRECTLFDGYSIPYGDDRFDLAILSHVVEHLEHPRKMLYEASRVAKRIFIEVPLEDTFRLRGDHIMEGSGHINFYSLKLIRSLVQTCGLAVVDQRLSASSPAQWRLSLGRKGYLAYLPVELALRASPGLATRIFTYNCSMVCARKEN